MKNKHSFLIKKGGFVAGLLAFSGISMAAAENQDLRIQIDNQTKNTYDYSITIPGNEHADTGFGNAALAAVLAGGVDIVAAIAPNDLTTNIVKAHLKVTRSNSPWVLWEGDITTDLSTHKTTYQGASRGNFLAHPYVFPSGTFDLGIWN